MRGDTARLALNLDGENYDLTSSAISDLKIKQLRIGYAWQVINIRDRVKLGPLVEARAFWLDASIAEVNPLRPGDSSRRSERFTFGLPSIGADLNVPPHRQVDIFATVSGTPAGRYGHLLDAEVGVKFSLRERLTLTAGYRYLEIHAKYESDFARLILRGPVVGAGFKF